MDEHDRLIRDFGKFAATAFTNKAMRENLLGRAKVLLEKKQGIFAKMNEKNTSLYDRECMSGDVSALEEMVEVLPWIW